MPRDGVDISCPGPAWGKGGYPGPEGEGWGFHDGPGRGDPGKVTLPRGFVKE